MKSRAPLGLEQTRATTNSPLAKNYLATHFWVTSRPYANVDGGGLSTFLFREMCHVRICRIGPAIVTVHAACVCSNDERHAGVRPNCPAPRQDALCRTTHPQGMPNGRELRLSPNPGSVQLTDLNQQAVGIRHGQLCPGPREDRRCPAASGRRRRVYALTWLAGGIRHKNAFAPASARTSDRFSRVPHVAAA
jgi:hypothetical protein